ncbi:MAG: hypothetical protein Q7R92_03850 [bacterium]|nr:hypothetical protein [bacterium]
MFNLRKVGSFLAVVLMAMFFCYGCGGGGSGSMGGNEPALTSGSTAAVSNSPVIVVDVSDQNTGTGERTSATFSLKLSSSAIRLSAPVARLNGGTLTKPAADMTYAELINAYGDRLTGVKLVFDGSDGSHIVVKLSVVGDEALLNAEIVGLSVGRTIIRVFCFAEGEQHSNPSLFYYGTAIFSGLIEQDLKDGDNNLIVPLYVAGSDNDPNTDTTRYYNLVVNNFPRGTEGKMYQAYAEVVDAQGDSWGDAYGVSAWYGNNRLTVGALPLRLLPPSVRIQMSIPDYDGTSIAQTWTVDALEILDAITADWVYNIQYDAGTNVSVGFVYPQISSSRYINPSTIENIDGGMGRNGIGVAYEWFGSLNQHYTRPLPYDIIDGRWLEFTSLSTGETAICMIEHLDQLTSYSVNGVPKTHHNDEYFCQVDWQREILNYTSTDNYIIRVLEVAPVTIAVDPDTPKTFSSSGMQEVGKFSVSASMDVNLAYSSIYGESLTDCHLLAENSYDIKAGETKEISVLCDIPDEVATATIRVSYLYFTHGTSAFTVWEPMEFSLTKM